MFRSSRCHFPLRPRGCRIAGLPIPDSDSKARLLGAYDWISYAEFQKPLPTRYDRAFVVSVFPIRISNGVH
jgi:hypothetical protein